MQTPYTPKHEYAIDEFVGHFDHFVRSTEGTKKEALMRYFGTRYPTVSEACYKMNRFGTAMAYLMQHLADFEQFVVVGDQRRGLVSAPIVVALARYYCRIPDEHLADAPTPEMILQIAREESEP